MQDPSEILFPRPRASLARVRDHLHMSSFQPKCGTAAPLQSATAAWDATTRLYGGLSSRLLQDTNKSRGVRCGLATRAGSARNMLFTKMSALRLVEIFFSFFCGSHQSSVTQPEIAAQASGRLTHTTAMTMRRRIRWWPRRGGHRAPLPARQASAPARALDATPLLLVSGCPPPRLPAG